MPKFYFPIFSESFMLFFYLSQFQRFPSLHIYSVTIYSQQNLDITMKVTMLLLNVTFFKGEMNLIETLYIIQEQKGPSSTIQNKTLPSKISLVSHRTFMPKLVPSCPIHPNSIKCSYKTRSQSQFALSVSSSNERECDKVVIQTKKIFLLLFDLTQNFVPIKPGKSEDMTEIQN